ncbi:MAG: hypothetical protein R6V58_00190, partial [Planctomycetota bacterium]
TVYWLQRLFESRMLGSTYRACPSGHQGAKSGPCSAEIRRQVERGRTLQAARFDGSGPGVNARMAARQIKQHCRLTPGAERLLGSATESEQLSARAHNRVLKVARTIADLSESADIKTEHVAEAIQYRTLDRDLWA